MRHRVSALVLIALAGCKSAPTTTPAPGPAPDNTSPPPSFVRSTADLRATRMIEVREGLARPQALRLVTETLEQRYVVEVTDPRAGFVMTAWQASVARAGVPDLRYRTRLTAKFLGEDWRTLQLRDEANWARGDEWDIGYDVAQLDTVASELRARLGKKQP
jgi:hypothetical protein